MAPGTPAPTDRPRSVTIVALLFVVAGLGGLAVHAADWLRAGGLAELPAAGVRVLAVVCGAFLLRGRRWARWLAVLWLAYHVALSALHSGLEFAVHAVLLVLFSVILFGPRASTYFTRAQTAR